MFGSSHLAPQSEQNDQCGKRSSLLFHVNILVNMAIKMVVEGFMSLGRLLCSSHFEQGEGGPSIGD